MKAVLIFATLALFSREAFALQKLKPYKVKSGDVKTTFTSQEILSAAYSDYRFPSGFYNDPAHPGDAVYYINSVSIGEQGEKENRQLCTDDPVDATSWDEMTNANSSVKRFLTLMDETERYYEFVRRDTGSTVLFRVHKCSYIDVGEWDLQKDSGPVGIFNKRAFSRSDVRTMAEYLWYIHNGVNRGLKVLSSFTKTRAGGFEHVMYVLRKSVIDRIESVQGGAAVSSREVSDIELTKLVCRVDKISRKVTMQSTPVKVFRTLSDPPEVTNVTVHQHTKKGN